MTENGHGVVLDGMDEVSAFYQHLEQSGAIVLWPEEQHVAVADWGFASEASFLHFVPGAMLAADGVDVDVDDPGATTSCDTPTQWSGPTLQTPA